MQLARCACLLRVQLPGKQIPVRQAFSQLGTYLPLYLRPGWRPGSHAKQALRDATCHAGTAVSWCRSLAKNSLPEVLEWQGVVTPMPKKINGTVGKLEPQQRTLPLMKKLFCRINYRSY